MTTGAQEDLCFQTLKDELHAEREILKTLLQMEGKVTNPKLKQALLLHRSEIEGHILRLAEIFARLGEATRVQSCNGTLSPDRKAEFLMGEISEPETIDVVLTSLALAVEHYEIEKDTRSKLQHQQGHAGSAHRNLRIVRS